MSESAIVAALQVHNTDACTPPLDDAEVIAIGKSVAKYPPGRPKQKSQGEKSDSVAQALISLAESATLFHDERNTAHAAITMSSGVRHTVKLRGKDFRSWLAGQYYRQTRKAANGEAITSTLNVLDARARYDSEAITLGNRFAVRDSQVWLDLADAQQRAVKITHKRWKVVANPPILFRRFSHHKALPVPIGGGNLKDLLRLLNIADGDAELLVLCWLVVAPCTTIPRPILWLHGPQGSAKTTAAQLLRALIDPSEVDVMALGTRPEEIVQLLDHQAVPIFDNLSGLQQWQADLLCRAVTGAGFSKRALFTDDDDVIVRFQRAMVFTGINVATLAPDLLDRSLLVGLDRIRRDRRREHADVWRQFEEARPHLLGALLDAHVKAKQIYPRVHLKRSERMADFARWGAAAAIALGYSQETFEQALRRNSARQHHEVIDADPLCQAVLRLARRQARWEGTATQLANEFEDRKLVSDAVRRRVACPRVTSARCSAHPP